MYKKLIISFVSILLINFFLACGTSQNTVFEQQWENPIRDGINQYGMKDFFVLCEKQSYFLVGTEYCNPFHGYLGPNLYQSNNFNKWKKVSRLINTAEIANDAWYKDGWFAPEILKIKNKYYFTFNNRNNSVNPYQKLGFGIAVSSNLNEDFKVINTEKPIVLGNYGSLVVGKNEDEIYLVYDSDARIYIAEINLEKALLKSEPIELLGPESLGKKYKFLDAPQITKIDDTYHMLFSQFYGGYEVKVFHMIAQHPKGPWKWDEANPLYTFLEEEADEIVKNSYPTRHGYAPPWVKTIVILMPIIVLKNIQSLTYV
jgi:beta-xylosidase